jgi:hypothetical protein
MQNTEASVASAGTPVKIGPAATPRSVIVRQDSPNAPTKQPANLWPGQKRPPGSVALAVAVVSGERSMGITPVCTPSQQKPPPGVQGQLQVAGVGQQFSVPVPTGHGVAGVPTPSAERTAPHHGGEHARIAARDQAVTTLGKPRIDAAIRQTC